MILGRPDKYNLAVFTPQFHFLSRFRSFLGDDFSVCVHDIFTLTVLFDVLSVYCARFTGVSSLD